MTGHLRTAEALASDGTVLAYQVQGDGPALVLLAGQANNHHWWDGVRDDFTGNRRTITMDYRGTGDSGKPDIPYSITGFVDDLLHVLEHAGVERADVYGTSMGGRVAQVLAAHHPDRVRRLILGCTSPGGPHSIERDSTVRQALADPDQSAADNALENLMFTPAWLAENPGPYSTLGDRDMPAFARRHHLRASNRHNAWDVLPQIAAPTLILHGADDELNPAANAALLAARIPNSRVEILPGARHAYFQEFRRTASALVIDFLRPESGDYLSLDAPS